MANAPQKRSISPAVAGVVIAVVVIVIVPVGWFKMNPPGTGAGPDNVKGMMKAPPPQIFPAHRSEHTGPGQEVVSRPLAAGRLRESAREQSASELSSAHVRARD